MRKYILLLLFMTGCFDPTAGSDKLISISIIDRNGLSETISKKERLDAFQNTNFLAHQPYQKVLRMYGRNKEGSYRSSITSYHQNGQVKQSLESVNNRAFGPYKEWYQNGQLKIESLVIGGIADINTQAEESWLFEGLSEAWDEEGNKIASIYYDKGELSGEAKYFHPNGKIWKISPYEKNTLHGEEKIYLANGTLFQTVNYKNGMKEGVSSRYWDQNAKSYVERYERGLLIDANYYSLQGELIARIENGKGVRAIFGKESVMELQEFHNGIQDGLVKIFNEKGELVRTFNIKNDEKEGEEIEYFSESSKPRLSMCWHFGVLQGEVKTWYENGHLESSKEMSQNKKNGHHLAWYENGLLMLAEEYNNDKLIKGEYYKLGEKIPSSKVERGKGLVSLFDSKGNLLRKILYQDGRPTE